MSLPASHRFVDIPEMLGCLGRAIINKALLHDLCLTNKSFRAAFIPFLYAEMRWDDTAAPIFLKDLDLLFNSTYLRYVRTLVFCVSSPEDCEPPYGELVHSYNEAVESLLQKLPNLETFSWSFHPLYAETISILHQYCPKLTSLSVAFPDEIEEYLGIAPSSDWDHGDGLWDLRPLFTITDEFSSFNGLNSLNIQNIHGDITRQRDNISKMLLSSPNLYELSLSMNSDAMLRLYHDGRSDDYLNFLKDLCDKYVTRGGQPLQLQKLSLGLSILPYESQLFATSSPYSLEDFEEIPPEAATYITRLTDLSFLEEVCINNGGREDSLELYFDEDESGIAWSTFTSSFCPNLKSVSIFLFNDETTLWLRSEMQHLNQLRVECYNGELNYLCELLNHEVGSATSTALELSTLRPSVFILEEQLPLDGVEWFLEMLSACTYLKGLKFVVYPEFFGNQDFSAVDNSPPTQFLSVLRSLRDLEELYVSNGVHKINTNGIWKVQCVQLANNIASALPKLRYLKIGPLAWRI